MHVTHSRLQSLVYTIRMEVIQLNIFYNFQYHIFQGFVTEDQVKQSFDTFEWIKEHPKAFARWRRDRREKDAVAWFNPKVTHLNPRWCPDIIVLYLRNIKGKLD